MKRSDWKYLINTLLFISLAGMVFIGLLMGFFLGEGPAAGGRSKYFIGLHRHQWGQVHFVLSLVFTALIVIHLVLGWRWMKGKAGLLFGKKSGWVLTGTAIAACAAPYIFWLFMTKNDPAFEIYGQGAGREEQRLQTGTRGPGAFVIMDEPVPQAGDREDSAGEIPALSGETASSAGGIRESGEAADKPSAHAEEPEPAHGRLEEGGILITGQMTLREISASTGVPVSAILEKLDLPPSVSPDETVGRLRRLYGFSIVDLRDAVSALIKNRENDQRS
jgi:hypothetical protein